MAKKCRADRNNELQRQLAVIAGCSWLLFRGRRPEKPSVSAAEANPLAVIFLHYQRTRRSSAGTPIWWGDAAELRRRDPLRHSLGNGRPGIESAADLLDRTALGLDAEERKDESCLAIPESEEQQGREDRVDCHLGADVIGGADDQREPERTDDLAEIADAIAKPHAAGAQPVRPHLCDVRPDNRVAGVAEETLDHDQHKENRHGDEEETIPIRGER